MVNSRKNYDYTCEDIAQALRDTGISQGDDIFIYSNIGFFGRLKNARSPEEHYEIFKQAIFSVIKESGTLVVPTFTYSFCWDHVFDVNNTPSVAGFFSESVRLDPQSIRSGDANFSVAAIGRNAEFYTTSAPENSFGPDSFWERFLKCDGKFCNFNFDSASTFIHYVERVLKVPYRFDKRFDGTAIIDNKRERKSFFHFVYDLDKPQNAPNFAKFDKLAKELGLARVSNLGRGQVVTISAKSTYDLIESYIETDPTLLIKDNKT
jgi:aminoglycoside 3-N-acetyltransferase